MCAYVEREFGRQVASYSSSSKSSPLRSVVDNGMVTTIVAGAVRFFCFKKLCMTFILSLLGANFGSDSSVKTIS